MGFNAQRVAKSLTNRLNQIWAKRKKGKNLQQSLCRFGAQRDKKKEKEKDKAKKDITNQSLNQHLVHYILSYHLSCAIAYKHARRLISNQYIFFVQVFETQPTST